MQVSEAHEISYKNGTMAREELKPFLRWLQRSVYWGIGALSLITWVLCYYPWIFARGDEWGNLPRIEDAAPVTIAIFACIGLVIAAVYDIWKKRKKGG